MKWVVRAVLAGVVALGVFLGVVVGQDVTLWKRLSSYPDRPITEVSWYEPVEAVPGSDHFPLRSTAFWGFEPTAEALEAFAAETDSAALLVLYDGQLVFETYAEGHTAASRTQAMSMSKTLVALLLGIAIDKGILSSVDEPVGRTLEAWSTGPHAEITYRHLLQMTSGLERDANTEDPWSDLLQLYAGRDAKGTALSVPVVEPPGQTFVYNNVNTQVISAALEKASGRRYSTLLSHWLWDPIGAGDAAVWLDRPGGNAKTFCCLLATAHDWARVGELIRNRGRVGGRQLVSEEWITLMSTPSSLQADYGLHLWLAGSSAEFAAADLVYLEGKANQLVYVIPSRRLVIVRLGERPERWDNAELPNLVIRAIDAVSAAPG